MAITRSCILASRVSTSSYLRRFLTAAFSTAPPAAKKVPAAVTAHGRTWQDPYQWMRNTSDPEFIDYIRRENSYAAEFMADTSQLQRVLVREMKSRLPAKVSTPPERWGNWLYYQYVPEGKEYPVLCRRLEENDDSGMVKKLFSFVTGEFRKEQTLLDWNEIAEQYGYVHVGTCRVSPSHDFIAYTVDVNGSEQFLLRIKDLSNGTIVDRLEVEGVVSLAWAQDGRTLFYTVSDNNQRPYSLMLSFSLQVYVIDAARPLDGLERICNRVSDVQCFVEHHYGSFFILTNAPLSENKEIADGSYYLVTCRTDHVHSNDLQQIILPSEDVSFHDMDVFHRHLVLSKQFDIEELNPWYFPVPTDLCSIVPGSNHEFSSTMYRVVLSSPVMPDAIVDYDMSKRTSSIVHQDEVRDRHYREHETDEVERWKDLSLERKQVVSHDGVEIPLTILLSRKAWRKGQSPGLLHGYGAYGETLDTSWSSERLSLLDRGWVIAFADVRGGGGNDSSWHKSGTMLAKPNSIHDFMSCASFLVDEGYVHSKKLAAQGTSAGGLLVAASINMKTDLFRAAILKVPFLDICNSLLDPSLPLTILDYEEFGNPQIESQFDCIRNYSPYDNIQHGKCPPAMLVTSSYNDSRVGVWEAAKWVARLRDVTCPSCSRSVVLKTSMNSGHFGEGGYYSQCEETAYEYAFLMEAVGEVNTVMN
ncbi:Dipeptidyl aminopeptidase BI [Linum perenne]